MRELRVPTTSLAVEIRCADGRRFAGHVYMPAQSARHQGAMQPHEWVSVAPAFFPFSPHEGDCRTLFNKREVVSLTVPAWTDAEDAERLGSPTYHVVVEAYEYRIEGTVVVDMPPSQQRLVDFLNGPDTFLMVRDGDRRHFVQKEHITRVLQIGEDR
jgi:hypothetical protein